MLEALRRGLAASSRRGRLRLDNPKSRVSHIIAKEPQVVSRPVKILERYGSLHTLAQTISTTSKNTAFVHSTSSLTRSFSRRHGSSDEDLDIFGPNRKSFCFLQGCTIKT